MTGLQSLVRPPPANFSSFRTPPPLISIWGTNMWNSRRLRAGGFVCRLQSDDSDPLLQAALAAASLRFQETVRPDPLFIDPYVAAIISHQDMDVKSLTTIDSLSPHHYRLATKLIDERLISLLANWDELRQVVLLTDGMDTRPYRLNWPHQSVIYDISPQRIFQITSQRLKSMGAKVSRKCTLVHISLESTDLQTALCKKGFNGSRPSLWALQGLPVSSLGRLNDILSLVSSLAMKGSIFMGGLSTSYMQSECPTVDIVWS